MLVEEDPISDGWLCDRGRYNIGFYESPDRLKAAALPQGRRLDADRLGRCLHSMGEGNSGGDCRARRGERRRDRRRAVDQRRGLPDRARLRRARHRESRLARRRASVKRRRDRARGTLDAIDRAEAIVVAGAALVQRAPVLWLRIQKAVRRRREADLARRMPALLAPQPETQSASRWCGTESISRPARSYAQAFADSPSWRLTLRANRPTRAARRRWACFRVSGAPVDTFAMLDRARNGRLAVLSIFAANPARNAPDAAAVRAALEATPFLVVSELFMTETAERAKLVLPAAGALEKSGTTMNVAGDLLPLNAALAAADFVRSDLEIVAGLAEQLEVSLPSELGDRRRGHRCGGERTQRRDLRRCSLRHSGGSVCGSGAPSKAFSRAAGRGSTIPGSPE